MGTPMAKHEFKLGGQWLMYRYLTDFEPHKVPHYRFDVVVVGGGAAGGFAALAAADAGSSVAVVLKGEATVGNTKWAKGGIATVLDPADSFEQHALDTIAVGCGLSESQVVHKVIEGGPDALRKIEALGAEFDKRADGKLDLSKEGGHSFARIVHADGDATGFEMQRAITDALKAHPRVHLFEDHFAIDVLTQLDGHVEGLLCLGDRQEKVVFASSHVVLATGGAGQIYRETTNPDIATGDGIAMALRAGATLRDMEFYQFHPTCLYIAGAARILISEIVRGAGGILRDKSGYRFMPDYHKQAELAPRDVVSRAIFQRMVASDDTSVYLDLSGISKDPHKLFPTISRHCQFFGIDIAKDPIPVRPGAHYLVGGIKVDNAGRTDVPGLWAVGECASTGLHGANRMGSNSLLEALVLGESTGKQVAASAVRSVPRTLTPIAPRSHPNLPEGFNLNIEDLTYSLKSAMWRQMGVQRDAANLTELGGQLQFWMQALAGWPREGARVWELHNMMAVSHLATQGALERQESRGVHSRTDYPNLHANEPFHLDQRPRFRGPGIGGMDIHKTYLSTEPQPQ
ncbi:MAG: L-aspartate oxidase [Glaciecola sp.]|jgi:L-aspartate oxidase